MDSMIAVLRVITGGLFLAVLNIIMLSHGFETAILMTFADLYLGVLAMDDMGR